MCKGVWLKHTSQSEVRRKVGGEGMSVMLCRSCRRAVYVAADVIEQGVET